MALRSWRDLTWREFLAWSKDRILIDQDVDHYDGKVTMLFECGAIAEVRSNYEGDYSEDTPGAGVGPPTVRVIP